MNCEEISELLPAYVLGALEPEEVEAVETHLRAGREHDHELVDLRATVFAMDRFQEDAVPTPSASLAKRVQALVRPEQAPAALTTRPFRRSFLPPSLRVAVAATVLLLVFGAGWLANAVMGDEEEVYAFALHGDDGAFMQVRGSTESDNVTVTMAGLDRLAEQSYQVWAIRDGDWLSMGVCNTNAQGGWVGDFNFQMQGDEEVALTIEPRGGSDGPTSEALLRSTR
jgi:anti-sigma-K factor RskA